VASGFGYRAPRAPVAPRVSNPFGGRVARNTAGYLDPFPSLSGQTARPPAISPFRSDASSGRGYGVQPARPPQPHLQAANPQAIAANQAAPVTPTVGYSYDADPVLNQIQALSGQSRGDAQANATALRLQLAQQYGDEQLARQYGGEAQAAAARANPNSVLAQLAHSYQTGQQGLEEALNQQNLFYGGARVRQLAELANQYQSQQAGAAGEEQGALGSITSNLAAAMHAADLQDAQAQQDAYNRQLQYALAAGGTGIADTGSGEPVDAFAGQPPDETTSGTWANLPAAVQNAAQVQAPYSLGSTLDALAAALAAVPVKKPASGYSAGSGANIH
jgi:hypothetical protein